MITGLHDAAREAGVIRQEFLVLRGGTDACSISIQDMMDADKILALFARDYK